MTNNNQHSASSSARLPVQKTAKGRQSVQRPAATFLPFSTGHDAIEFPFNEQETGFPGLEQEITNHWSVPWADLMMVMFVLFASLVAVQALRERETNLAEHTGQKSAETIGTRQPSFDPLMQINVLERSREAVREAQLDNVEIILLKDQSVKVSVQGPLFFELGKAELRPQVKHFLDQLAIIIRQTPYQVQVIGHTDDYPINTELFPSNWELSAVRASRVARYLLEKGEIDPARFTIMGRSKYQPAQPNTDDTTRALNRRVEIIITRDIAVTDDSLNPEIKP